MWPHFTVHSSMLKLPVEFKIQYFFLPSRFLIYLKEHLAYQMNTWWYIVQCFDILRCREMHDIAYIITGELRWPLVQSCCLLVVAESFYDNVNLII